MSYTVLNSAMSSTLLSDPEVAGLFSADADLVAMLDFEAALAEAEAEAVHQVAVALAVGRTLSVALWTVRVAVADSEAVGRAGAARGAGARLPGLACRSARPRPSGHRTGAGGVFRGGA